MPLKRNESGQGLTEYLIIVALVAIIVIFALRQYGGTLFGKFQNAAESVDGAGNGGSGQLDDGPGMKLRESSGDGDSGAMPDSGSESASTKTSKGRRGKDGSEDELSSEVEKFKVGVGDSEDGGSGSVTVSWSTIFTFAAAVVAFGVFVVFRMSRKKDGKKGKKRKSLFPFGKKSDGESGQAIAEFVLVAITFLFTILALIQLALILNAYTMVRYAAYNAARAAIVHGGDPDQMLEAARLSLVATAPSHGRADHPLGFQENYEAQKLTDQNPLFTEFFEPITSVEIVNNVDRASGQTFTFDDPRDAGKAIVTVKVKHYYELVIPLANRILYFVYRLNRLGPGYSGQTVNELARTTDVERRSGSLRDIEFRIPLVAHYTMRMQSDLEEP